MAGAFFALEDQEVVAQAAPFKRTSTAADPHPE